MSKLFCPPKFKPVENTGFWRDTRPGPNAVHHGVYTPVLNLARPEKMPFGIASARMEAPKKPRGTV